MLVKAKLLGLLTGKPVVILPKEIAKWLDVHIGERIKLKKYATDKEIVAIVDIAKIEEKTDYIYISDEIAEFLNIKENDLIEIYPSLKPMSVFYIKKKLDGKKLNYNELYGIIKSIVNNELTEAEVAYFISAGYLRGMCYEEIKNLVKAMVDVGNKIKFNAKYVLDKHCIGGLAGNRTTPIVTSIIAASIKELKLNAVMPKTSSRAITSAAGTADVVEQFSRVEFTIDEIKKIVNKAKACLVWGGSLGLSPADDKIIQVERLLNLDPPNQLVASIMSKKIAVGSNILILDIPYGKGSKIENKNEAIYLKNLFERIAKDFNIKIKVILTDGSSPIGNGIGPVLEAIDVIKVLKNKDDKPIDLYNKSLYLAKELLKLIIERKKAENIVEKVIKNNLAFEAFKKIIQAQGGKIKEIEPSNIFKEIKSNKNGKIKFIDNKKINFLARILGCPSDKSAGIYLNKKINEKVERNETYITLYAETKEKLEYGYKIFNEIKPIIIK
ncbi:MAG: thymidine phosphorylase [Candidatus Pacearchaeota archaeon]